MCVMISEYLYQCNEPRNEKHAEIPDGDPVPVDTAALEAANEEAAVLQF